MSKPDRQTLEDMRGDFLHLNFLPSETVDDFVYDILSRGATDDEAAASTAQECGMTLEEARGKVSKWRRNRTKSE